MTELVSQFISIGFLLILALVASISDGNKISIDIFMYALAIGICVLSAITIPSWTIGIAAMLLMMLLLRGVLAPSGGGTGE